MIYSLCPLSLRAVSTSTRTPPCYVCLATTVLCMCLPVRTLPGINSQGEGPARGMPDAMTFTYSVAIEYLHLSTLACSAVYYREIRNTGNLEIFVC